MYHTNSNKSKEEKEKIENRPKLEPVAKGVKRKNILKNIIPDEPIDLKSKIVADILIPAAKKTVSDIVGSMANIVKDTIDIQLYGEIQRHKKRNGRTGYSNMYNRDDRKRESETRITHNAYDYESIDFETRQEAEAVLDGLIEQIEEYGIAKVADFYELIDMSASYTANDYGWRNLKLAEVYPVRRGWKIRLPKPKPIL